VLWFKGGGLRICSGTEIFGESYALDAGKDNCLKASGVAEGNTQLTITVDGTIVSVNFFKRIQGSEMALQTQAL